MGLRSNNLKYTYKTWAASASPDDLKFVDDVYELCERNYANGGDDIVEAYTPSEVLEEFQGKERNLEAVKQFIGIRVENATNFREGLDTDPELERLQRYENDWED